MPWDPQLCGDNEEVIDEYDFGKISSIQFSQCDNPYGAKSKQIV